MQCTDELKAAALGKNTEERYIMFFDPKGAYLSKFIYQEYMKEYYARESQFVDTKTIFLKCWSKGNRAHN